MARATSYGAWRAAPRGNVPDLAGIAAAKARTLVHEFLRQVPAGGLLSPGQTADLLGCYRIPLAGGEDPPAAARAGGTEVIIRVEADHTFGPLVIFGPGGPDPSPAGLMAGHAARLTPLTDIDADQLISSVYPGGSNSATRPYVRDLLLRVSRLTDDLPEVAGLDLNPVTAWPDRAIVRAARITVAPCEPQDPFLRKLR
jgi:ATP-grasp domain